MNKVLELKPKEPTPAQIEASKIQAIKDLLKGWSLRNPDQKDVNAYTLPVNLVIELMSENYKLKIELLQIQGETDKLIKEVIKLKSPNTPVITKEMTNNEKEKLLKKGDTDETCN